ncbi:MAG: relaxase domain-containing protein, partial [Bacteroidota bacterium]
MTGSKFFTIAQELAPPTERGHLFAKCISTSQMKANRAMLDCISWLCESRTGTAGSGPKISGKPMFLTFPHRLSREGDQAHHFHNILINTMECTDGKYRAIDLNPFFKNDFLFTVGQFYRDQEARFLNEEFTKHGFSLKAVPYEITNGSSYQLVNNKGEFIPETVTSHFSKRSQQIDEELAQQGIINPTPKQRRRAAYKTRKPKQSKGSIEEQRAQWRIEVGKLGFSLEDFCPELTLTATVERNNKPVGEIEIKPQSEVLQSLVPEVSSVSPEDDEFQPDQEEKSIEFGPEASSGATSVDNADQVTSSVKPGVIPKATSKGLMPTSEELAAPKPADGEPSSQHFLHKPVAEITVKLKSEALKPLLAEALSDSAKVDTKSQPTKREKTVGLGPKAAPEVISVNDAHQILSPVVSQSKPEAKSQVPKQLPGEI